MKFLQSRNSSYRFQVLSDLHLEVGSQYATFDFPQCAPYLILAGDIGRLVDYEPYLGFVCRQCDRFKLVFLVLGNHEFYGVSRADGLRTSYQLQSEPVLHGRLKVLQQGQAEVGSCLILGCTLNSYILPEAQDFIRTKIKDFQRIKDWTIEMHNASHLDDVAWLEERVQSTIPQKVPRATHILVITHNAPTIQRTSRPDQVHSLQVSAFATDLRFESTRTFSNVRCWIYGHTHYSNQFSIGSTQFVSNQRGYAFRSSAQPRGSVWGLCAQGFRRIKSGKQNNQEFNPRVVVTV